MRHTLLAAALVLVAGLAARPAAQRQAISLWVTLGDSDQLVEVDPWSFRELRRIRTDPKVHGLAASSDGSRLYVTSDKTGNFQVIDAVSGRITGQLALGTDPNQMAMTRDGRFAFVPMRGEDAVAVVEIDPLRLVKKIPMNKGPHDAYTSPDGSRIYVGAQYGNAIAVFDPLQQTLLHQIPTSAGVRPMAPTRDGRNVYVALSNLIGFGVADTVAQKVTRLAQLATKPDGLPQPYADTFTHALQLMNNDTELWVTDCVHDLVRVVRTKDLKEVAQIQVGHFPHWFAVRPDLQVVFVSLWFSDAVALIDIGGRKVLTNVQ